VKPELAAQDQRFGSASKGPSMKKCLICAEEIAPFISFGRMPIANGFLTLEEFKDEFFFDLQVGFCRGCTMVQLTELVDPEKLFHDHYAFFSSTSSRMREHFKSFADQVKSNYLQLGDPFVVELGSNDGIMLQNFAAAGIRHLGVEPSTNVAEAARTIGVNTISDFFSEKLARKIVSEYGQANAVMAANVMCHIPDLHSVVEGMRILLSRDGVVVFEDPYIGDIVERTSYDQIYDEHAFYFSLSSISQLFGRHGMEVIDALPQSVHGGSMRYVIARKGERPVHGRVQEQLAREEKLGLRRLDTYKGLCRRIEASRDQLMKLLNDLRKRGKRIVGYAATSKSTTVTNYCGITPDHLEYISDTTPIKQGKCSPGAHIPVRPNSEFQARFPDYALLFGWNHAEEIMEKEQRYRASGGKWIVYVPEVKVVP
jgi:methylation protein EvaC